MSQDAATRVPAALTIAGSDPSGGAGIQADLKTFTVLGVYGASVLTALTAQSTRGVAGILAVPPAFVTLQIATLADDLTIRAVKTGMLNDRAIVVAVGEALRQYELKPVVVDPVMVATSGDMLLEPAAVEAMRAELVPLADVLTPNLAEAARLLDRAIAGNEAEMEAQTRALLELGATAVVLKGGHGEGAEAVDIFLQRGGDPVRLSLPRIATSNTHGTGCTFAAALAAYLVRGHSVESAAGEAKRFVHNALQAGAHLAVGRGPGPVDHLHTMRPREDE
jgi:hydroxymethylpyrimidine/phosphomethylpyrimidine kinase